MALTPEGCDRRFGRSGARAWHDARWRRCRARARALTPGLQELRRVLDIGIRPLPLGGGILPLRVDHVAQPVAHREGVAPSCSPCCRTSRSRPPGSPAHMASARAAEAFGPVQQGIGVGRAPPFRNLGRVRGFQHISISARRADGAQDRGRGACGRRRMSMCNRRSWGCRCSRKARIRATGFFRSNPEPTDSVSSPPSAYGPAPRPGEGR